ncbi:hypothetical protein HDU90_004287 [Geranomyces variabilis]|nr:hypothetical protein HDU90_004287 [Geranomyces variabilis]
MHFRNVALATVFCILTTASATVFTMDVFYSDDGCRESITTLYGNTGDCFSAYFQGGTLVVTCTDSEAHVMRYPDPEACARGQPQDIIPSDDSIVRPNTCSSYRMYRCYENATRIAPLAHPELWNWTVTQRAYRKSTCDPSAFLYEFGERALGCETMSNQNSSMYQTCGGNRTVSYLLDPQDAQSSSTHIAAIPFFDNINTAIPVFDGRITIRSNIDRRAVAPYYCRRASAIGDSSSQCGYDDASNSALSAGGAGAVAIVTTAAVAGFGANDGLTGGGGGAGNVAAQSSLNNVAHKLNVDSSVTASIDSATRAISGALIGLGIIASAATIVAGVGAGAAGVALGAVGTAAAATGGTSDVSSVKAFASREQASLMDIISYLQFTGALSRASSVNSDSSVAGSSGVYRTANKLGMTDRDFFAAFTLTMTFSYILIFVIGVALYPVAKLLMARCKPGSSNFRNTIGAALRKYVASPRL